METTNKRVAILRKALKMNQKDFAESLAINQPALSMIENGQRDLSEKNIKIICMTYKVSQEWLLNGTGEMFVQNKRKAEIADFIGTILSGEADDFKIRLIEALANLDESDWETLEKLAISLAKKNQ